jgi:hypothetical protein
LPATSRSASHEPEEKIGSSTGASRDSFLRPTPNEIVRWISSAKCSSVERSKEPMLRSVRMAALPQAMSNPTPTTDALLS